MYNNEILFTKKFLSMLVNNGVKCIPFRDENYARGVKAMKRYFAENQEQLDPSMWDIKFLFFSNGDFSDALMAGNGDDISLQNPRYEKAVIQMSSDRARLTLDDPDLQIPQEFLAGMVNAFCTEAGVRAAKAG